MPWLSDRPLAAASFAGRGSTALTWVLQVRPGHCVIEGQHDALLDNGVALQLPEQADPWPGEEVWVFSADTENRLVEVSGVTSIDPRQTKLPVAWQKLPAYRMKAGDTVSPLTHSAWNNPDLSSDFEPVISVFSKPPVADSTEKALGKMGVTPNPSYNSLKASGRRAPSINSDTSTPVLGGGRINPEQPSIYLRAELSSRIIALHLE